MIEFQKINNIGYHLQPEFAGADLDARWVGKGSRLLGLPEEFDPVMYERLMNGRNPHDGSKLSARLSKVRRLGWDMTLTNEKEVSVLELVGGDERIGELRWNAMEFAVDKLEKQIAVRVRKDGKNTDRTTANLVGAAFPHETNRLGEPHGHFHVCVANVSWDKTERIWKAVELGQVDRMKLARDYHKYMADGMKRLGYRVKWFGSRYDVAGVEVADRYSDRGKQIKAKGAAYDASAVEKGTRGMSAKQRAKLPLYDRPEKVGNGSREDMRQSWLAKLTRPELTGLRTVAEKARKAVRRGRSMVEAWSFFDNRRRYGIEERGGERTHDRSRGR